MMHVLMVVASLAAANGPEQWTDPSTGSVWNLLGHSVTWDYATAGCAARGERLPTLDEWWDAYDRIKDTELARGLQTLQLKAWTSDRLGGSDSPWVWTLYMQSGNGGGTLATEQAAAACLSSQI